MKRRHMNSVARDLTDYLFSRNNDINGYWGIGVLCLMALSKRIQKYSFKIYPGLPIKIYGCELSNSESVTVDLMKYKIDSIECRMSFFDDGRFANGKNKYTCGLAIAITQSGRSGMYISHVSCWPHDSLIEKKRFIHASTRA